MQNIKKFPRLKQQIQEDLTLYKQEREEAKAQAGWLGSKRSQAYLRQHKNRELEQEGLLLKKIIRMEPMACQANNI